MQINVAKLERFGWKVPNVLRAEVVRWSGDHLDHVFQACPVCDRAGGEIPGRLWLWTLMGPVSVPDGFGVNVRVHHACLREAAS